MSPAGPSRPCLKNSCPHAAESGRTRTDANDPNSEVEPPTLLRRETRLDRVGVGLLRGRADAAAFNASLISNPYNSRRGIPSSWMLITLTKKKDIHTVS